jgi:DNA adenine methylase
MKTPIAYYGGKQSLTDIIVPLIPAHRRYCEPFTGGAAVFFAKPPSKEEILNDLNVELVTFWEVLKTDYTQLNAEVQISLHSRKMNRQAQVVYEHPDMFDRVKRAWAVWYLASSSFGAKLNGSWGHDIRGKRTRTLCNKRNNFLPALSDRLRTVSIENCNAIKVINDYDEVDSFFYVDPPYVDADQGHYEGYTQETFDELLKTLAGIQGKFLLSSYPNNNLDRYKSTCGWYQIELKVNNPMLASCIGHRVEKTEVLTANYPIRKDGYTVQTLF